MMKTILVATALSVVATAVSAERQPIDQIVALVDDHAIFQSDVETVVKQYMFQQQIRSMTAQEREALVQKILQDLINDKLVIAQAGRLNVDVPFKDVEEEVTRAIESNRQQLTDDEFERQLEREGFTLEELKELYRTQIRNRMLVERVLQMEMQRNQAEVSDEELRKMYEERYDEIPERPAVVHLRTIFIGFDTSESASAVAKQKIDDIYERVSSGESFTELAKEFSEDPSAPLGGDLGFLKLEDLREPTFRETVANLGIGDFSEPVKTSYGYHIIQVAERNLDADEVRVKHILVRIAPSDNDIEEVFKAANDVYEQLKAGADFEDLARKYSSDPSASEGGDLGWLKVEDLPPFFRDVLGGLTPGSHSQVLRESSGFRIVELVEIEEARKFGFEEVRERLRQLYQQEQMGLAYSDYVEGLREKFTVDIKVANSN